MYVFILVLYSLNHFLAVEVFTSYVIATFVSPQSEQQYRVTTNSVMRTNFAVQLYPDINKKRHFTTRSMMKRSKIRDRTFYSKSQVERKEINLRHSMQERRGSHLDERSYELSQQLRPTPRRSQIPPLRSKDVSKHK